MTYLDYVVLFEKYDHAQAFSGNTTRLYLKLLALANSIGWPDEFAKSDPYVAAVCGFSINTMKDCRAQLVTRGLLSTNTGGTGRNAATTYRLINPSKFDAFRESNPSENTSNFDGFTPQDSVNPSTFDAFRESNPSENTSNFDTLYIDKENNTSAASVAGVGASLSAVSADEQSTAEPRLGRATRKRRAAPGPVELLPTSCPLAELLNPGGLAEKVQLLAEPLTLAQATRLLAEYNLPALRNIFCEMANWQPLLTKSTSANLTARNWLDKRPRATTAPGPTPTGPTSLPTLAEEELDEPARLFRAEQAAKSQAAFEAHIAHWANRPATNP